VGVSCSDLGAESAAAMGWARRRLERKGRTYLSKI